MSDGHCTEGARCVCGGDLPSVRAGCHYWRASAPKQAQETSLPPQGAEPVAYYDWLEGQEYHKRLHWIKDVGDPAGKAWIPEFRWRYLYEHPAALAASPAPATQEPVARFDDVVAAELSKVSTVPYNSHEICKWFADNVRKALYASPAPGELGAAWQPIETAPKDGTAVLCFWHVEGRTPDGRSYGIARCDHGQWHSPDEPASEGYWADPNYWMPLPQPPQQAPSESSAQGSGGEKA